MFDAIDSLRGGFQAADRALLDAQRAAAQAESGNRRGSDLAMAKLARAALFGEALLASTHARLQEIATAAKA